jgi:hypothetical protein
MVGKGGKMKGKRHKFWNGEPTKKGGIIKFDKRKRGKQTIEGNAVYISSPYHIKKKIK